MRDGLAREEKGVHGECGEKRVDGGCGEKGVDGGCGEKGVDGGCGEKGVDGGCGWKMLWEDEGCCKGMPQRVFSMDSSFCNILCCICNTVSTLLSVIL